MYAIVKVYDDNDEEINGGRIEPFAVYEKGINTVNEFRFNIYIVNDEKLREALANCNKEAKDEL